MKKTVLKKQKATLLTNPLNSEQWMCEDFNSVKIIDGVNYVTVYKPENSSRTFLMRKDALKITTFNLR